MEESAISAQMETDGSMGTECAAGTELKPDGDVLINNVESDSFPNKKEGKDEVLNEDIKSEVSDPSVSLKEITSSFQDISSQKADFVASNGIESNEVTTTCSGNSSSEATLSDGEDNGSSQTETSRNDNDSRDMSTSHVVLEIPKHVHSSSGIRKITFKFSKRKEEYVTESSAPVDGRLTNDEYNYRVYDNIYTHGRGSHGHSNHQFCSQKMELKMSKKVVPNNYPTNVKKLLSTGILDGARVKYISTTQERELHGIVNGGGYLCGCSFCNYSKVLNAHEFEQHAGVKTRHPNNHIYLENGKPIYSIIQELKTAPLGVLEEAIKNVAGSSVNEGSFQVWKASLQQGYRMDEQDTKCDDIDHHPSLSLSASSCSSAPVESQVSPASYSFVHTDVVRYQTYMKEMVEARKRGVKRARSSISNTGVQLKKTAEGGTKRRDNDLHRLLFLPNGLQDATTLAYCVKGQRLLDGYKQGNGIVCSCCSREISPSQFEAHAGMAARRQPYRHIYADYNGLTLHDMALFLAKGQPIPTGQSDDMCTVCGDGGDMILCARCPRGYHKACLGLQFAPEDAWFCPFCCGDSDSARKLAAGEFSITSRSLALQRKTPEADVGGCVVCRAHDFSSGAFGDRTVIYCDQCEKEFHVGCLRGAGLCDLKEIPKEKWFCCDDCSRIYRDLQNYVSIERQMVPVAVLSMISTKHGQKGLFADGNDVQWQILSKKSGYTDNTRALLSSATAIFRERFDPIRAECGRDLIPLMVYGRNISGQEFGGIYCVVLIVNSIVVSVGLLRVFGREVAELPLVATSRKYQNKGCFQALFSCIQELLRSLNVENLVLPAAEKAESFWTKKFGFRRMTLEQLAKYRRELQLTMFHGSFMMEKKIEKGSE